MWITFTGYGALTIGNITGTMHSIPDSYMHTVVLTNMQANSYVRPQVFVRSVDVLIQTTSATLVADVGNENLCMCILAYNN